MKIDPADKWDGFFTCGNCMRKDDDVHPLWPPKIRCEVTGRVHRTGDICDCSYSQLKEYDEEHTIPVPFEEKPPKYIQKPFECRKAGCYAKGCCLADYELNRLLFKGDPKRCRNYKPKPPEVIGIDVSQFPDVSLQRYIHISEDGNIEIRESSGWKMNIKIDGDIEFFDKDGKRTMVVFNGLEKRI